MQKELSKMTKKEKKEYYKQFRGTWSCNPVTRRPPNPKAYNRQKSRSWKKDIPDGVFLLHFYLDIIFLHSIRGREKEKQRERFFSSTLWYWF